MKNPISIMQNSEQQKSLQQNGFLILDFLGKAEIEQLSFLFAEMNNSRNDIPYDRLYTCLHNSDAEYRNTMNTEIGKILSPKLDGLFKEIKNTVYTFQIKGIGPDSELYSHQDWSFTREEDGYRTYTFWISLIDSNESNGTLSILPGSHHSLNNIRGAGIEPLFSGKQSEVIPFLTPLSVKAGQLVLFDSALLHYSAPNYSDAIRVSVMTNIIPHKAAVYLYFGNTENPKTADEYEVPDDFFLRYKDFKTEYEFPPSFGVKMRSLENVDIDTDALLNKQLQTESPRLLKKLSNAVKNLFNGVL